MIINEMVMINEKWNDGVNVSNDIKMKVIIMIMILLIILLLMIIVLMYYY